MEKIILKEAKDLSYGDSLITLHGKRPVPIIYLSKVKEKFKNNLVVNHGTAVTNGVLTTTICSNIKDINFGVWEALEYWR
jgi:hypothetical protein